MIEPKGDELIVLLIFFQTGSLHLLSDGLTFWSRSLPQGVPLRRKHSGP
jgi:hypothetical protein